MQKKPSLLQKALSLFGRTSPTFFTDSSLIGVGGQVLMQGNDSKLLQETYATSNDVYSIIGKILISMRMAEWEVVEIKKDGTEEPIFDSGLIELMNKPNQHQSWQDIIEYYSAYYLMLGNSYMAGVQAVGFGDVFKEINILPADKTEIILDNVRNIQGYVVKDEIVSSFQFDEVKHIKNFNPIGNYQDRMYGMSPIRAAYNAIITGKNQWEANASILKNKGIMGIITSKSNVRIEPETKKEMDFKFRQSYGGPEKFGTPMLASGDLSFIPIGMSPSDLKLIELGVIPLRALCNLYGVDSSLLNDPENKTYSNRKEAEKAMWDNAIIPNLNKGKDAANSFLVPAYAKKEKKNLKICYKLNKVNALQVDKGEAATRAKSLVESGIASPNEGREIVGLPKSDIPEMDIPKRASTQNNQQNIIS